MPDPEKTSSQLLGYASGTPLAQTGEVFRSGELLVVRDNICLRESCVLCGEPAYARPLRLKFSWDSSFQVAKTSTLELRRSGCVHVWLCKNHWRKWRGGKVIGAAGMTASAALMLASLLVAAISENSQIPRYVPPAIAGLIAGFALFIAFMFLFTLRTRTLRCRRIEEGYLYLEGVASQFLQSEADLPADANLPLNRRL